MIWVIRIFLLGYAILYFGIGAWAIIDPVKDALDLSEIPSYMNAVGLTVSSEIGYSEVAGLYGGINMVVGLLCFLGLFSRGIAAYACFFNFEHRIRKIPFCSHSINTNLLECILYF